MTQPTPRRAIVMGASSGLGLEISRQLLADGWQVAMVSRRGTGLEGSINFSHDVQDSSSIPSLFLEITRQLGGLDAFFYVAGVMPAVHSYEYDFEKDSLMIQVNCAGAVAWLNEAATRFGNVGAGTIVGISSVAGERGRQGQPVYNASKSFLNSYMESLRNRLSKLGVAVTTIKPGPVATPMTEHLDMKKMPVEVAAGKIIARMSSGREIFLSPVHWAIFGVIRNVPSAIFRRLKL